MSVDSQIYRDDGVHVLVVSSVRCRTGIYAAHLFVRDGTIFTS